MKLREMFGKAVRPRVHEKFKAIELSVPEFDDEDSTPEALEKIDKIGGLSIVIEYENARGECSQRLITCRKLSVRAGQNYINAFCHHREAARCFRIDRIIDVFDALTGESLSPAQAFFSSFEPDNVSKSGLTWGLSVAVRADVIVLLNALVFIARCDKEFHSKELQSLEEALTSFWIRLEILGDPDFEDILDYAGRLAPDGETFWVAMHRFREDERLAEIFRRSANRLIQADGVIHENEAYWSVEIDDFLAEP